MFLTEFVEKMKYALYLVPYFISLILVVKLMNQEFLSLSSKPNI